MPVITDLHSDDIPDSNTAVKGQGLSSHAGNSYKPPYSNSEFSSSAKVFKQHGRKTSQSREHRKQTVTSSDYDAFQAPPSNTEEANQTNYGFFWSPLSSQFHSSALGLQNGMNKMTLKDDSDTMSDLISFEDEVTTYPRPNTGRKVKEEPMPEEEVRYWDEYCSSYKEKVYDDNCELSDMSDHDSDLSTLSGYEPDMDTEDDNWPTNTRAQNEESRRFETGGYDDLPERAPYLRHVSEDDPTFHWQPGSLPTSIQKVARNGLYRDYGHCGEITTYPTNANVSSENIKAIAKGPGADHWLTFGGGRPDTKAAKTQFRREQISKLANFLPHGMQLSYDDTYTLVHLENVYQPADANKLLIWLTDIGRIQFVGVWQDKSRIEAEQAEAAAVGLLYNKYSGPFWPELERIKDCLNFELSYAAIALGWADDDARYDSDDNYV